MEANIPSRGQWPVDPQEDEPVREDRIWIDGCFDFFHHGAPSSTDTVVCAIGHAGVMLQARQLGAELYVGIHSDEEILENKGPSVMNLKERVSAADACRWVTKAIPHAPYVTALPWISHYGCRYVVHGDDISSDSSGEDCYRYVKHAGRFKVVKRTPGISTTDLVGRMLLCTKTHFIRSLEETLEGRDGGPNHPEQLEISAMMRNRISSYATDESGHEPGVDVYFFHKNNDFRHYIKGKGPKPLQRIVYVDGGFDLFSSGHIEFLRSVSQLEAEKAQQDGWYAGAERQRRIQEYGHDFERAFVIAGVHDDEVINQQKGLNYPIMNLYERGLCVLQCKYIHCVVFGAPFEPDEDFLKSLPCGVPQVVYHGPTSFMRFEHDPYKGAKNLGIFQEIPRHDFQEVNAGHIVDRITNSRARFEERQRAKGVKGIGEEVAKRRETEAAGLEATIR